MSALNREQALDLLWEPASLEGVQARVVERSSLIADKSVPYGGDADTTDRADVTDVRVVQAVDFVSDDPAYAGTMTMSWVVTPGELGTRVDITAEDVPAGISAEDHAAGLASSLENLDAYVER